MKKQKEKAGFGPGHFPMGTIARVEVVCQEPYDMRVDRILEQSAQGWVLETDLDPNKHTGKRTYNSNWVTAIISRGTGRCKVIPYHEPVKFTHKRYEKQEPYAERRMRLGVSKSDYLFDDFHQDLRAIIYHYPQYADQGQQHLFDYSRIAQELGKHAKFHEYGRAMVINKKKFHRVLKASMARFKMLRSESEKAYRDEQNRWGEEMMRDMYEHDEKMLDDDERRVLDEQHQQEENIFQNDGLDDAIFEGMCGESQHD